MGKFRTWLCFINPIHTTWRDATPYPLSRQLHFVYLNVFFTWLSCLTLNLGFMTKKYKHSGISKDNPERTK